MPLGMRPVCTRCKNTQTTMWRKGPEGEVLCNSCSVNQNGTLPGPGLGNQECKTESVNTVFVKNISSQSAGQVRKSARLKPSKNKYSGNGKYFATKGKNRRVIFKKNLVKSIPSVATVLTSDYIFFDGIYWQLGDIASVVDHDGSAYYVQIRGFLQDQFCSKSAVITWLLPTSESKRDSFDPSTYILGPEEDLPRPMEVFEFVCHAPSDYFKSQSSPYPTKQQGSDLGYISTSLGSEIRLVPTKEEIFGLTESDSEAKLPKSPGGKKDKADKSKDKAKESKKEKSEKKETKAKVKEEKA